MLITPTVRLTSIVKGTWKHFLIDLCVCIVAYFFNQHVLANLFDVPPIIPTLLGTALAFFIGFNNNQAYDRWWEARKIWGALVNDSRSWTRQLLQYTRNTEQLPETELLAIRKKMVMRHLAFVYALKESLRGSSAKVYHDFLSEEEIKAVEHEVNRPNALLMMQSRDLEFLYRTGAIDGFKFLELNRMITNFCDQMGQSERIRNTIFPTTYSYYSRFFIWIFIICVTLVTADMINLWAIGAGTLVGYVFLTIHTIGQALLNPFDYIPTGIPLDQISRTIEINLLRAIDHPEIPDPIKNLDNEYVM
ncbi:bestrophin family ion channel [Chryseolinea sp. T2]|uniref:bestrophin family protein n=1 Tax=Chryseolinea sp. T2 TaxID=3129255 RepID=UPI003076E129